MMDFPNVVFLGQTSEIAPALTEQNRKDLALERAKCVTFIWEKHREEWAWYCGFSTRSLLDIECDLVAANHDLEAIDASLSLGYRVW
jgi:hypothetical protein